MSDNTPKGGGKGKLVGTPSVTKRIVRPKPKPKK